MAEEIFPYLGYVEGDAFLSMHRIIIEYHEITMMGIFQHLQRGANETLSDVELTPFRNHLAPLSRCWLFYLFQSSKNMQFKVCKIDGLPIPKGSKSKGSKNKPICTNCYYFAIYDTFRTLPLLSKRYLLLPFKNFLTYQWTVPSTFQLLLCCIRS